MYPLLDGNRALDSGDACRKPPGQRSESPRRRPFQGGSPLEKNRGVKKRKLLWRFIFHRFKGAAPLKNGGLGENGGVLSTILPGLLQPVALELFEERGTGDAEGFGSG